MNDNTLSSLPEFDNHAMVVPVIDESVGLKGFIAIHRGGTPEHPAFGATRLWKYESENDALRDALRLSHLMSYKAAIAGFSYGGGKGVLMMPEGGIKDRKKFFEVYAEKVNALKGGFITGTDVGVTDDDIHVMKKKTPYVIGSKLDPAYYTAGGVVGGIRVCLERKFGSPELKGHSFAIQGLGKVGSAVLKMIYADAGVLFVSDINKERVSATKEAFPNVIVLSPDEIHRAEAEVFVPCALGGVLNEKSVGELKCKIIAGSANNQLADKKAADAIYRRNILYAPDYVINTGGFISVLDEYQHGTPEAARIFKNIDHMKSVLGEIFDEAAREKTSPDTVADHIVETFIHQQETAMPRR
jgi:leucine dehydrogenase